MNKFNEVEELEQLNNLKNEGYNLKEMTDQIISADKIRRFKEDIYKAQEKQIIEEFKEFISINDLNFEEIEIIRKFVIYQIKRIKG